MKINIFVILVIFACLVISVNALRSISESYNVGTVYDQRKKQVQTQYIELIKKKNELDYINTPFFAEKQLRESLNYYKKGEKLVVFTEKPESPFNNQKTDIQNDPFQVWIDLIVNGLHAPKL